MGGLFVPPSRTWLPFAGKRHAQPSGRRPNGMTVNGWTFPHFPVTQQRCDESRGGQLEVVRLSFSVISARRSFFDTFPTPVSGNDSTNSTRSGILN
ncbi:hypothetical protein, partial [Streptoalloteichus hindustanus]|uniref:hypothetical protein n=1 Tax=Streptoalloteichus hindustanus TaxID=2017 RepID=UPI001F316FCE